VVPHLEHFGPCALGWVLHEANFGSSRYLLLNHRFALDGPSLVTPFSEFEPKVPFLVPVRSFKKAKRGGEPTFLQLATVIYQSVDAACRGDEAVVRATTRGGSLAVTKCCDGAQRGVCLPCLELTCCP